MIKMLLVRNVKLWKSWAGKTHLRQSAKELEQCERFIMVEAPEWYNDRA